MNSRESLETELNELLQQLSNLQLQQQAIQKRIPEIVAKLGDITSPRGQRGPQERTEVDTTLIETRGNKTPVAQRIVEGLQIENHETSRERFYNKDFQPRVNNEVCILNP